MKKMMLQKTLTGLIIGLAMVLFGGASGFCAVPDQISYQGQLTDNAGSPVADGDYIMQFFLYNADLGGTALWNSPSGTPVYVENGVYNVMLGAVNSLDFSLFNSGAVWLEVVVNGETLSPRQQVTATAYALKAGDADTLEGSSAASFALAGHDHDTTYVNEGQSASVTSAMIRDNSVGSIDVTDNSLTASDLAANSVTSSELAKNSVGSEEVIDNSLTSNDLGPDSVKSSEIAANAVGGSEIAFPLYYVGTDANGGVWDMNNTNAGSTGNYPAGISGSADATPSTGNRIMGVMGLSPKLGNGAPVSSLPTGRIGVAGATTDGHAVAGVSTNGVGVRGESSRYNGVEGVSTGAGNADNGVYGETNSTYSGEAGVYGKSTANASGVYANSTDGDGIYATTGASDEHAGYFYSSAGIGLAGAVVYAKNYNSSGQGVALHAHNDYSTSTDAAIVSSNDGTGPLFKGFGGDGGNEEFRIDNNGSIHVYDPSISDDVLYFNASSGYLYLGSGSSTTPGDDGDLIIMDSSGSQTITMDGATGKTTTKVLSITGGSDLSEQFDIKPVKFDIGPGMVVSIDPENPGNLLVSTTPYDNKVAGIISGANGIKTGMMMGQQGTEADGKHPVALTGRVYCKADTSNGPIQPGDLLTTSSVPGHAMKATDRDKAFGATIGKAMTALEKDSGMVLVLVSLQ